VIIEETKVEIMTSGLVRTNLASAGNLAGALFALMFMAFSASASQAVSLDGAWAQNASTCKNIFVKKGKQTFLSPRADFYGSGFVIDGNTIRGKMAMCKITSRKEEGDVVQLQAACATDISMSNNRFGLKIVDDNKIIRMFPDVAELDTPYYRCPGF
jgi:hypothetical protein